MLGARLGLLHEPDGLRRGNDRIAEILAGRIQLGDRLGKALSTRTDLGYALHEAFLIGPVDSKPVADLDLGLLLLGNLIQTRGVVHRLFTERTRIEIGLKVLNCRNRAEFLLNAVFLGLREFLELADRFLSVGALDRVLVDVDVEVVLHLVRGNRHLREDHRIRRAELDRADLDALWKLEGLLVVLIPLLEPSIVQLDGIGVLLVLRKLGDLHREGVSHVRNRAVKLHRRGPGSRSENGLTDAHQGDAALQIGLKPLGRQAVLAQQGLIKGEAEAAVSLEGRIAANHRLDFGVRRLKAVLSGDLQRRVVFPRLEVDLGGAALPIALLAEPANFLSNIREDAGGNLLAAQESRPRATLRCLAANVRNKEIKRKKR